MESLLRGVSIIVTSYNAEKNIGECVSSLLNQDFDDFEVILVDGGSSDGTVNEAQRGAAGHTNFQVIVDKSAMSPASGRNRGAQAAKGSFLAFTDSDCVPARDWLSKLMTCGRWRNGTVAVGGKTLFTKVPDDRGMLKALHGALSTRLGNGGSAQFLDYKVTSDVRSLPSCNVMYRADIFKSNGGFDESLRYCEDSCLNAKIRRTGLRLAYVPEAVVYHKHRGSTLRFVRWIYEYGRGRTSAIWKDRKAISLNIVLLGLTALLLTALALRQVFPLGVLLPTVLGSYCIVALGSALVNAEKRIQTVLLYFAGYIVIHLSYTIGLFVGIVRPIGLEFSILSRAGIR